MINHGNVTPDYDYVRNNNQIQYETRINDRGETVKVRPRILGGFTIFKATQTTVLSLSVLRRLRFPLNGAADSDHEADLAARTALAALGAGRWNPGAGRHGPSLPLPVIRRARTRVGTA